MAMIETVPAFTIPSTEASLFRISQLAARFISRYRRYLNERQLARLDPATLTDIGVPHDRMTAETGELTRYPNIIKVSVQRI